MATKALVENVSFPTDLSFSGPFSTALKLDIDQVLQRLYSQNWCRLPWEYDDPLDMLFANRAKQWTAGWDATGTDLYVLVWEAESWQSQPFWRMFRNGETIFQIPVGENKNRDRLCRELMESKHLPIQEEIAFLEVLSHFQAAPAKSALNARKVWQAMLGFPGLWARLKTPLFTLLEDDLDFAQKPWPVLDVLKLHRLSGKMALLWLCQQACFQRLINESGDLRRLKKILSHMSQGYEQLLIQMGPILQPAVLQAQEQFYALLAERKWLIWLSQGEINTTRDDSNSARQIFSTHSDMMPLRR